MHGESNEPQLVSDDNIKNSMMMEILFEKKKDYRTDYQNKTLYK